MRRVLAALRRKLKFGRLEREEYMGKRVVGNTDSMTASHAPHLEVPPNYVPPADEGRPHK